MVGGVGVRGGGWWQARPGGRGMCTFKVCHNLSHALFAWPRFPHAPALLRHAMQRPRIHGAVLAGRCTAAPRAHPAAAEQVPAAGAQAGCSRHSRCRRGGGRRSSCGRASGTSSAGGFWCRAREACSIATAAAATAGTRTASWCLTCMHCCGLLPVHAACATARNVLRLCLSCAVVLQRFSSRNYSFPVIHSHSEGSLPLVWESFGRGHATQARERGELLSRRARKKERKTSNLKQPVLSSGRAGEPAED